MKLPHLELAIFYTQADFPKQDWSKWEARRFSRAPAGSTIDTKYWDTRPCCIHCAIWICQECWEFRRSRATRNVSQYCPKCGGTDGFFAAIRHFKPHEALPAVPFIVPRMMSDDEARAMRVKGFEEAIREQYESLGNDVQASMLACPAGDPCPATGCPACCPSYDPCGQKSCRNCNPKEGDMHVPEEAELTEAFDLSEEEARDRGLLPPKVEPEDQGAPNEVLDKASEAGVEEILPHVVTMASDTIREAFAKGAQPTDKMVLTIMDVQELCNLAVQAQYQRSGVVEAALRRVLAEAKKRDVTDKDRELIAKNAKATIERRDAERAQKLLREMAMHHSVELHKAALANGQNVGTPSVVSGAQQILDWLTDGKTVDLDPKS